MKSNAAKAETKETPKETKTRERSVATRPFAIAADEVAAYFGFQPVESFIPGRQDREYGKELMAGRKEDLLDIDEEIAFIKKYLKDNWNELPHPLLLASHAMTDKKSANITLRILGIQGSTAEALGIRTALSILEEAGYKDMSISLGSIGDRESMTDFDRAAQSFIRKNLPLMPMELRKTIKEHPLTLLVDPKYAESPFAPRFPTPISSLSQNARAHLREVIEYIEAMNAPYTLEPRLIAPRAVAHHTMFEIKSDSGEVLARGMRFSPLTKRMGAKREIPLLSVVVKTTSAKPSRKALPSSQLHFVQLGYAAKLLSLPLVDALRKEGIPLMFHLSRDRLQNQLSPEETTPFILIMGHKEALDKTVVIRDNETRAQEAVPLSAAPDFIKKVLKKGKV